MAISWMPSLLHSRISTNWDKCIMAISWMPSLLHSRISTNWDKCIS
jgi:hypothetical protein